ncbi:MAG: bifunctional (p)ppGpp synthetase/guanosine-3',5'-bis(diphosphate) 3'-pyrophosphohydrolase [Gammaproteobacteria bacterium]|nr:bifunctional (p)ppGpp synthetase/guanosine-3',5'-bis(diphosphate) 3'-pyrophosphohydrolase [Gammaproteobacteria bacterium]NNC96830.1 bifunctional (p)ppGpp synthetase/guanosine-3',5'-bis(diphosphate) 3'-pyrophosphohydrolase [Gammaproteobacteria bacterium]NNM12898.1 bifunctional (p)ppGpp synthetase/guanosine-3',5'-bis(diphosphate) 3'-pyrophosphohydrolase [Gammaproteobacteria bacterium]
MEAGTSILDRLHPGKRAIGIVQLLDKVKAYLNPDEIKQIQKAFTFGFKAHDGQKRKSGVPYISHPVAVASILADMEFDHQTLIAAILHDTIEDTEVAREDVALEFGESVAALVDGVSKLDQLEFRSREEAQAESFRKLMLAMSNDVRVILIKLADRLHNMRTLGSLPQEKKRRIARETLDIYAPLAHRLGMHEIKQELEKLGLKAMYPDRYRVIKAEIQKTAGNQKQVVRDVSKKLKKLTQENGIDALIEGRNKEIYSIYKKMQSQRLPLRDIVDIFGLRIVVHSVDECYRVLGIVHTRYRPMLGKFKDYIAIPKQNGYQSLHTTVLGPRGMPIEIQIRTVDMHRLAEAGIAAHWHYKNAVADSTAPQIRAREWIEHLIGLSKDESDSKEFVEDVKTDLFPGKVFVFTPKGRIIRLVRSATPVDFAYAIHTDIGHRCIGAKVDRRMVALSTKLENGQTVEIVTDKKSTPNPAWLNFVATPKARHAIRQYIRSLTDTGAEDLGKRMLDRALRAMGSSLKKISRDRIQELANEFDLTRKRDLFREIGLGQRLAPLVAQRLLPEASEESDSSSQESLTITGTEGLVVTYGKCCYPIPGDDVIGYLTVGRGIVIHRDTCGNLVEYRNKPSRWLEVEWENNIQQSFLCEIKITTVNKPGVLAIMSTVISDNTANIASVSVQTKDDDLSLLIFQIYVKNTEHLAKIIHDMETMDGLMLIERT